MLVICCGNLRSGSTLQYQIAGLLAVSQGRGGVRGYGLRERHQELQKQALASRSWVVVKEHAYFSEVDTLSNARFLYSYRDLRDALASLYQKGGLELPSDQLLSGDWGRKTRAMLECMIWNDERWRALSDVLVSRYEDFKSDVRGEVERIAAHLGVDAAPEMLDEIASSVSLERQQEYINEFDFEADGVGPAMDRYDPVTQLHASHLNGGQVGKWRSYFSAEQITFIDDIAAEWLARNGYARCG